MSKKSRYYYRFSQIHAHNKVVTVKSDTSTYTYRMGDEEYLAIYSLWIDDPDWYLANAEYLSQHVARLEIGAVHKPHSFSVDAFKTRQKLDFPIYFEPAEMMRIFLIEQLVVGLPQIHLFGVSADGRMI